MSQDQLKAFQVQLDGFWSLEVYTYITLALMD
jgi:hypothetical protein